MVALEGQDVSGKNPLGRQLRLDLERPQRFEREAFVVSGSNRAAVEALDAWPEWLGSRLAIVGPEGVGKTHLLSDFAERTGAVLLNGVTAALIDPVSLEGRPVVLDDAETVDDEILFHLINMAERPGGSLLLASRTRPARWEVNLRDLRSRLNAIRVIEIEEPDDQVLRGVLESLFERRAIRPSPDLIEYLVKRIERSAAAARDTVARIDEASEGRPVTRALARTLLDSEPDLFE